MSMGLRSLHGWAACCVTVAVLALFPAAPARAARRPVHCPRPGTAAASEACVRQELGIPPDAQRVAIVSQSSHLDWDWRHTFEDYFQGPLNDNLLLFLPGPVDTILSDAMGLMTKFHASKSRYYYSVAEMGYLERFVEAHPDAAQQL